MRTILLAITIGLVCGTGVRECLERLEKIVQELEKGEVPLEKSLTLFEEGMQLSASCRKQLEEAETRVESLAELVHRGEAVPQIIGIVDFEAPSRAIALGNVAGAESRPATNKEVLVTQESGRAPHPIESCQRVAVNPVWIPVGQ